MLSDKVYSAFSISSVDALLYILFSYASYLSFRVYEESPKAELTETLRYTLGDKAHKGHLHYRGIGTSYALDDNAHGNMVFLLPFILAFSSFCVMFVIPSIRGISLYIKHEVKRSFATEVSVQVAALDDKEHSRVLSLSGV